MGTRVLLVEDDASLSRSIVDGLSGEGFAVAHVADGDSAREVPRSGRWELVIRDRELPGPDGSEVLAEHRCDRETTPAMYPTARDAVGDRVRGRDGGADDYLGMPFALDELLTRALVRRGRAAESPTLAYQDVRVDLAAQRRAGPASPGPDGQGAVASDLLAAAPGRDPFGETCAPIVVRARAAEVG